MTALVCVGRIRERSARALADEYIKRIGRYTAIEEIETRDLPEPARLTNVEIERVLNIEGEALLRHVKPADTLVALTPGGKRMTSEAFAEWYAKANAGSGRLCFAVGGSMGLSGAVFARTSERLSLSDMTLPHALARIVLLEQIYRACKINANERYHK